MLAMVAEGGCQATFGVPRAPRSSSAIAETGTAGGQGVMRSSLGDLPAPSLEPDGTS